MDTRYIILSRDSAHFHGLILGEGPNLMSVYFLSGRGSPDTYGGEYLFRKLATTPPTLTRDAVHTYLGQLLLLTERYAIVRRTVLPPRSADTMSDAIAQSSPNGRTSGRSRQAATKRLAAGLFGEGLTATGGEPLTELERAEGALASAEEVLASYGQRYPHLLKPGNTRTSADYRKWLTRRDERAAVCEGIKARLLAEGLAWEEQYLAAHPEAAR